MARLSHPRSAAAVFAAVTAGLMVGLMIGVVLQEHQKQQPVMLEGYAEPEYIAWLRGMEGDSWKGPRFSDDYRPNNPVEVPLEYYFASVRCHMPPCSAYETEPAPLVDYEGVGEGEEGGVPEDEEPAAEEEAPKPCAKCNAKSGGPSDNFPFDEPLSPLTSEGVHNMFDGPEPCACEDDN